MAEQIVIAETDEHGAVAWLWLKGARDKAPRPFDPAYDNEIDLGRAEVHGAHTGSVRAWLAAAATRRARGR
ncbi:hypothetical protein SAMN05444722_1514 [Rhodovulum sp. ES.010]|uniref:hypothetical protein n=1 Tax=Rhodovulum sp. ES.010 TaxID=1882821 RepID=UPI000926F385|nr:hypothetical protein [Rhodovulum sp. ES.010]SIO33711.1 hypothetical protein SAMN05444722_1514 [Rhodovulum sp. ES.010]